MKKTISVVALTALLTAGSAWASGYRIPEQSVDSTAKSGANIASATDADASYFNPANMSWMAADTWQVAGDLTYIHLSSITYTDDRSATMNGESEKENFLLPTVFMVSPDYNNFRFGFSVTAPYGLSKRWNQPFPRTFSEEYSLKVFDINPTISYKLCDYFSIAAGPRLLYSSAKVSSNGVVSPKGYTASRFMEGDTTELGWNAALSARPMKNMTLAVTYRSEVDLGLDGDALLGSNTQGTPVATGGSVTIPAPAVLSLSGAYTFDKLTVDLTWDRTYWSDYENITFLYDAVLTNPVLAGSFGRPIVKNWEDSDAYRLGLSYALNETWALMAGFAYDKTPVPDATLGFELPDSDAYLYSVGVRYQLSKQMELGAGYLYDYKKSRTVTNAIVDGTFTDSTAHLLTVGLTYTF
ncbi:MAG: OmpP1/FadL family transporter [Desulfocapsaceae bacterium]|nr:OmpP1/FadL family transporter [Desulfocapsaceae bacterium]